LLVTWDEQANGTRRVVAAQGAAAEGKATLTRQTIGADRSEYPAATAVDDGFAVAFTNGSATQSVIRVQRITTQR
jgi:hypothetical protein